MPFSNFRASLRLGVEGVEVGHAARHKQVDDAFGLCSTCCHDGRICGNRFLIEKVCRRTPDGKSKTGLSRGRKKSAA